MPSALTEAYDLYKRLSGGVKSAIPAVQQRITDWATQNSQQARQIVNFRQSIPSYPQQVQQNFQRFNPVGQFRQAREGVREVGKMMQKAPVLPQFVGPTIKVGQSTIPPLGPIQMAPSFLTETIRSYGRTLAEPKKYPLETALNVMPFIPAGGVVRAVGRPLAKVVKGVKGVTKGNIPVSPGPQISRQQLKQQVKVEGQVLQGARKIVEPSIQKQEGKVLQQAVKQQQKVGVKPPLTTTGDPSTNNFISSIKQKANSLYTQMIDRFNPLSQLAKQAGEDQSMRSALTAHYGAGSTANYHIDFELSPILKEQNINNLRRVAIAARDAELAQRGVQGSNTGLTFQGLQQELGTQKFGAVQETLKRLYTYQDNIVKTYLVDTGIISKETYQKMRVNNQFYVPFKRVMDVVDEHLGFIPQTRQVGSISGQDVVYRIKGSQRQIIDPIESILEATYKSIGLGRRQQVAQTIVNLKNKLPEGMVREIKGKIGNIPNVALFENGKVKHYTVPFEVAEAAKGLSEEGLNTLIKILQYPTSLFRATATGINPEFMAPNVFRDVQAAFVNVGLNPLGWLKGLAHQLGRDEIYQEFLRYGGRSTTRISIDRPMLTRTVSEITGPKVSRGLQMINPANILKTLQIFGEYSETPTRVAVFEQQLLKGLKQGFSRDEAAKRAAYWAQEATVNFARRGSKTQSMNAIYAFLNARVQGVDRLVRSAKNDPIGVGFRLAVISQFPALSLYAWNRKFDSYFDTRVVTDRDKENNFIFMLSDQPISQLGGAQFIKIPKGDIGKMANPTEQFLAYADSKGGDIKKGLVQLLKGFSPMDNIGDTIPTALRPPIEVAANKSFFFNQPIVPEYKKSYPPAYQETAYTAPLYRMIGQQLNVSPAKIQALVEGYGTGLAKIGELTTRPFIPQEYKTAKSERGAPIQRIPVVRRFLGGEKRTYEEQLKTYASMPVDVLYDKLVSMDRNEANKIGQAIKTLNPSKYTLLKKYFSQRKIGLSNEEIQIGNMSVHNGDRANAIKDRLKKLKTKKEKNAYVRKLQDAKIITDQVYKQLKILKAKGEI